jgi:hypothetical protein
MLDADIFGEVVAKCQASVAKCEVSVTKAPNEGSTSGPTMVGGKFGGSEFAQVQVKHEGQDPKEDLSMKNMLKVRGLGRFSKAVLVVASLGLAAGMAAGPASAAPPNPAAGGGMLTTSNAQMLTGVISQNVTVPAGTWAQLQPGAEVQGNVIVKGTLAVAGGVIDKNLTIDGGGLTVVNYGLTVKQNVTITDSYGASGLYYTNAFNQYYAPTDIGGNLVYSGNQAELYIAGLQDGTTGVVVHGNFNFSDNQGSPVGLSNMHVDGTSNIS